MFEEVGQNNDSFWMAMAILGCIVLGVLLGSTTSSDPEVPDIIVTDGAQPMDTDTGQ